MSVSVCFFLPSISHVIVSDSSAANVKLGNVTNFSIAETLNWYANEEDGCHLVATKIKWTKNLFELHRRFWVNQANVKLHCSGVLLCAYSVDISVNESNFLFNILNSQKRSFRWHTMALYIEAAKKQRNKMENTG